MDQEKIFSFPSLQKELKLHNLPCVTQRLILDSLSLSEVLNLRLVNHSISSWISQDYLQCRISSIEVKILNMETLNRFLSTACNLPFTRFYFGFSPKLNKRDKSEVHERKIDYNCRAMKKFTLMFGSRIKYLHVYKMFMCTTSGELSFYESLTSLKCLKIRGAHKKIQDTSDKDTFKSVIESTRVPSGKVLLSLEELSISSSIGFYAYDFFSQCPNLLKIHPGMSGGTFYMYTHKFMEKFTGYVRQRLQKGGKVNLEIDLHEVFSVHGIPHIQKDVVVEFVNVMIAGNIKLSNVNGSFLNMLEHHGIERNLIRQFSENVLSIYGLPRVIYECPIVREINLTLVVTSEAEVENPIDNRAAQAEVEFPPGNVNPQWESLQEIKLKIVPLNLCRSYFMGTSYPSPPDTLGTLKLPAWDARVVSGFLLGTSSPNSRNKIEKVNFSLAKETSAVSVTPEDFACRFPNLTHLQLEVDCFSSSDYTQLFRLLGRETQIKSLRINTNVDFTDEIFMGAAEDTVAPFGTLHHLQIFELVSHSFVRSHITDKFFIEVLQGMSLHIFHIRKDQSINVTDAGINALLNGHFAKSIRCFDCCFYSQLAFAMTQKQNKPSERSREILQAVCDSNCKLLNPKYQINTFTLGLPTSIISGLHVPFNED